MNRRPNRHLPLVLALLAAFSLSANAATATPDPASKETQAVPVKAVGATASSSLAPYSPEKAIDGVIDDKSRWVSGEGDKQPWIEIDLGSVNKLSGIHLYSGYGSTQPLDNFVVQFRKDGQWIDIPSARFHKNEQTALAIPFDDTVNVTTDRLRIQTTGVPQDTARIKEVVIWPASGGNIPPVKAVASSGHGEGNLVANEPVPLIYLNQSGFNIGKPKRFTAPTLAEGTPFVVRPANGGDPVFKGTLKDMIGDFSGFEPGDDRDYVVEAGGEVSVPFRVGQYRLERVTYQNAVNFMIDSRHHVGNVRTLCVGSFGWRDDHHFGWEISTLVAQYISNPSAYDRMPHQIKYEAPSDPKLWGKLQPYNENAPDVVKLIHWGADIIVTQGLTHELLKAQLAYFLYAWPVLKEFFPAQNYEVVRDFAFAHWSDQEADQKYRYDESRGNDLLALKTNVGSTKGALPPGFSIEPNLLMHEVAKREGRPDAERYLDAACKQAEWMVANTDWNDPQVTKGQRMSEFVTMTGLAHLLESYPDRSPKGLKEKINAWADVVVRRSSNLWDFRKLDDGAKWTPTGDKPTMWNEPGNVVGLPAALLAAKPFLTNSAVSQRIDQLVWSHFDNMFGRNPSGRHFSYAAPKEIEGVEHGWYTRLAGGIGQLRDARFVIDGSPKDAHFPYHPEKGNIGWTEGWVQFNTPFNVSLAYLAHDDSSLQVSREGNDLLVRLTAPVNFDPEVKGSATVGITVGNAPVKSLTLTQEKEGISVYTGRISLDDLKAAQGGEITVTYGFGYLGQRAVLKP